MSSDVRFALARLAEEAPVLVEGARVFLWDLLFDAGWRPMCRLENLECMDYDAADNYDAAYALQIRTRQRAAEMLMPVLPPSMQLASLAIAEFAVQAERYKVGKRVGGIVTTATENTARYTRLRSTIGCSPTLIHEGKVYVDPRPIRMPPSSQTPLARLMPLLEFSESIEELQARYHQRPPTDAVVEPHMDDEDISAAVEAVDACVKQSREFLDRPLIYDSPDTGLKITHRMATVAEFTISSGPYVVEDSDGTLYRFEGFVVATSNRSADSQVCDPPALIYPQSYRHWLYDFQPLAPLHLCDFMATLPEDAQRLPSALTLLLGARHTLRASLYCSGRRRGNVIDKDAFRRNVITRRAANGLPIYPYRRSGGTPGTDE